MVIALASATLDHWAHLYTAPAAIAADEANAHFEVRPASNPFGYEIQDIRPGQGQTYTAGFSTLTGVSSTANNVTATVAMLCNPYASEYPKAGGGSFPDGPVDPIVRFLPGNYPTVNVGAGQGQPAVMWTLSGDVYYPGFGTIETGVQVGIAGALRFVGTSKDDVKLYGANVADWKDGQRFGTLDVVFKDMTIEAAIGTQYALSAQDSRGTGRIRIYNVHFQGSEFGGYGGLGYFSVIRALGGACWDMRDTTCTEPQEHFFYANSVGSGTVAEDSWLLRCLVLEGAGRTHSQILARWIEVPGCGPGRGTILLEDCEAIGCAQQGSSSIYSFAGHHGDIIMRRCIDRPLNDSHIQSRSIVAVVDAGGADPTNPVYGWKKGTMYDTANHHGNHGRIAIIDHESTSPKNYTGSHWGLNGFREVHIFNPRITGNKRGIELDHSGHTMDGLQFDENGDTYYSPLTDSGENISNNPHLTEGTTWVGGAVIPADRPRVSLNGHGKYGSGIGPGYEFIYVPSNVGDVDDWEGWDLPGPKLVRCRADLDYPLTDSPFFTELDPNDYRGTLDYSASGTSTASGTLRVRVGLAGETEGGSSTLGFLILVDSNAPQELSGVAFGESVVSPAALTARVALGFAGATGVSFVQADLALVQETTVSKTNTLENDFLLLLFNNIDITLIGDADGLQAAAVAGSLYVSLHTSDPGETGTQSTSEATYTAYARVAVARSVVGWTVTSNTVVNAAAITFPTALGGSETVTHFGVGTSSSGVGKLLYKGSLTTSLAVSTNITPNFAAESLTITED